MNINDKKQICQTIIDIYNPNNDSVVEVDKNGVFSLLIYDDDNDTCAIIWVNLDNASTVDDVVKAVQDAIKNNQFGVVYGGFNTPSNNHHNDREKERKMRSRVNNISQKLDSSKVKEWLQKH